MLCRQSALVICPEAAEPLYFLRSSICAATLTIATTAVHAVQIVLLTPTDNLARALYRPLVGYARFSTLGARICSGPCGSITPPSSPIPGSVHSSPPSARGDGGLSARGRTNPHILVGTPEAVLAHLSSETAPPLAKTMLMVVCHAHDVLDGGSCECHLGAVMRCISASQARPLIPATPHASCCLRWPTLGYPRVLARCAASITWPVPRHGTPCDSSDHCGLSCERLRNYPLTRAK